MILNTISNMLTKTQLKILAYLIDNQSKLLGIRELAKEISSVYYLVQKNIHQLKNNKIINLQSAGRTNIISLAPEIDSTYLVEAEKFKRELFYKKYPYIKVVLKKIIEQSRSCFFVLLIFGSYVQQPRKDSDLDLLVIVSNEELLSSMEKIISSISRTSTTKIHDLVVTEESFKTMLQKKELNVALEVKNKHVLLYGSELYYKLIK